MVDNDFIAITVESEIHRFDYTVSGSIDGSAGFHREILTGMELPASVYGIGTVTEGAGNAILALIRKERRDGRTAGGHISGTFRECRHLVI